MKVNSENLNINLRHVRALHSIVQHGSFSAAASALGIVPSALSEVIRQLEAQIGAPLFDRATRPPAITPLGREFLADTEPFLDGMDRAITRLRQSAGMERGSLAVGAAPSAISGLVAPVLAQFLSAHPGIACVLHDDLAENLAAMVADGRLDLAVAGRAEQTNELTQRTITHDPFGLACRADHPLLRQQRLHLCDIPAETLIGLDANTGTTRLLHNSGLLPPEMLAPRLRAYSTVAQLSMIRAGMGVALLPRDAVLLFRDPTICFRPVDDLPLWRTLFLVQSARRPLSVAAQAFRDALERHLPDGRDDQRTMR